MAKFARQSSRRRVAGRGSIPPPPRSRRNVSTGRSGWIDQAVIQIIGEEAIDSGIEEICIITQPARKSSIASISSG